MDQNDQKIIQDKTSYLINFYKKSSSEIIELFDDLFQNLCGKINYDNQSTTKKVSKEYHKFKFLENDQENDQLETIQESIELEKIDISKQKIQFENYYQNQYNDEIDQQYDSNKSKVVNVDSIKEIPKNSNNSIFNSRRMSNKEIISIERFKFSEKEYKDNQFGVSLKDSIKIIMDQNIFFESGQKDIQSEQNSLNKLSKSMNNENQNQNNEIKKKSEHSHSNYSKSDDEIEFNNQLKDVIFELQNHPDIGIVIDKEGRIKYYNNSFITQLKFYSKECINTNIKAFIHFQDHTKYSNTFNNFVKELDDNSFIYDSRNENYITEPILINISDKNQNYIKQYISFENSINNLNKNQVNNYQIKIRLLKYLDYNYSYQISPRSSYYFIWTIILTIMLIYILWESTIDFSFNSIINENQDQLTYFVTIIFSIDLIQNFFVAQEYANNDMEINNLETNNQNIVQNQLTTQFIVDLISTIPFEFLKNIDFNTQKIKLIKFVKTIKLFRLMKVYPTYVGINQILKQEQFSEISIFIKANIGFLELAKVVCFLLIVTHFYTCIQFQQKTEILENQSLNWTLVYFGQEQYNKDSISVQIKIQCEMLKTSLGLNSIKATDTTEVIMDTMWIMLGLSIFGYGIGNISSYLSQANKRENEMSETLKYFRELQEEHECEHLNTLIEYDIRDQQNNYSINEFSKQSYMISENIKTQIDNSLYSKFIKLHSLFGQINIKSVKKLKQSKIKSDKNILRSNEVMNSIYLVLKGTISIMNNNLCTINEQKSGEIFGMIHFKEYQQKKYNIDLENLLSNRVKSKNSLEKNDSKGHENIQNSLNQTIIAKMNNDFLMIQNNVDIKCEQQALSSQDETLQIEINQNILEEIVRYDIESFQKIYRHSLTSLELISDNEYLISKIVQQNFENCNMYGMMIKQNGFFYDINIETRRKIIELGTKFHDISFLDHIKKVQDQDIPNEKVQDIHDIKLGNQSMEFDQTKYYFELEKIDQAKIARTDIDTAQFKLKKSLEDVIILYFKKE